MEQIFKEMNKYFTNDDNNSKKNIIDEIEKFVYFSSPLEQINDKKVKICDKYFEIPINCFIDAEEFKIHWMDKEKTPDNFNDLDLLKKYYDKYLLIKSFLSSNNYID